LWRGSRSAINVVGSDAFPVDADERAHSERASELTVQHSEPANAGDERKRGVTVSELASSPFNTAKPANARDERKRGVTVSELASSPLNAASRRTPANAGDERKRGVTVSELASSPFNTASWRTPATSVSEESK
jgi:hypothetical protein